MLLTVLAAALLPTSTLTPARPQPHPPPLIGTALLPIRAASNAGTSGAADVSLEERELVDRINAERTERGLCALTLDPLLVQAARGHCWDMSAQGYFSHVTDTARQRTPLERYLRALESGGQSKPGCLLVGENIYYCSRSRPRREVLLGHQALMNSPDHRANILDPRFARIGVGIRRDAAGRFWVTEMFLRDGG